jgi:hypothetical protein
MTSNYKKQKWLILITVLVLAALACGGGSDGSDLPSDSGSSDSGSSQDSGSSDSGSSDTESDASDSDAADSGSADDSSSDSSSGSSDSDSTGTEVALDPIGLESGWYYYSNSNQLRNFDLFDGRLWAGGPGGVIAWDPNTLEYRKYTPLDGLLHGGSPAVAGCNTPEPTLLAGTHEGLVKYDPASDSFVSASDIYEFDGRIFDIRCDETRIVFHDDNDINILDVTTGQFSHIDSDDMAWISVDDVNIIGDELWMPSPFGLTVASPDGIAVYGEDTGHPVLQGTTSVAQTPDGRIWLGGDDGLILFDAGGAHTLYTDEEVPEFGIFGPDSVHVDTAGNLWLGFSGDVCQWDLNGMGCLAYYEGEDGMADGTIVRMTSDDSGNLYYMTYNDGMSRFDGSTWAHYWTDGELPDAAAWGMIQDVDGNIWIQGEGLYRTDIEQTSWTQFSAGNDDFIADPNGGIWSTGGWTLWRIVGDEVSRWGTEEGLYDAQAMSLEMDSLGRIWVGQENAVSIFDGAAFTTYGPEDGFPEAYIRDMQADQGGDIIWVSATTGLIKIDTLAETWEIVISEEDFTSLVSAITFDLRDLGLDTDGSLLIGTPGGLLRYDGASLEVAYGASCGVIEFALGSAPGTIWVSCGGLLGAIFGDSGVYFLDTDSEWYYIGLGDGLPVSVPSGLLVDSAGTVWMGGGDRANGGGILRWVP